jgi:hypothetical protein
MPSKPFSGFANHLRSVVQTYLSTMWEVEPEAVVQLLSTLARIPRFALTMKWKNWSWLGQSISSPCRQRDYFVLCTDLVSFVHFKHSFVIAIAHPSCCSIIIIFSQNVKSFKQSRVGEYIHHLSKGLYMVKVMAKWENTNSVATRSSVRCICSRKGPSLEY